MLRRTAYVGVEYYGMRKQIRNSETGQQSIICAPESEWLRRESPHLRIISDELWEKAQRRMQACRDAYSAKRQNDQQRNGKGAKEKGQSRSAVYPRTLFRPLCAHCKTELWFGNSGKYSSFCCPNGRDEKCGCKLKTHKSVQIVEEVILAYLRDAVFTPTFLQNVLVEANSFLIEEAQKPKEDIQPLLHEIKEVERKLRRLVDLIEKGDGHPPQSVSKRIQGHERRLEELRATLQQAKSRNEDPPRPISAADVDQLLADLRSLLMEDMAVAAPILAELCGPILVHQGEGKTKNRTPWMAHFTVNAVPVLARLAAKRDCPSTGQWEYLSQRGWTIPQDVELRIEYRTVAERLAGKASELAANEFSKVTISRILKTDWSAANDAVELASGGSVPKNVPDPRKRKAARADAKYIRFAEQVVNLRENHNLKLADIAETLNIGVGTVGEHTIIYAQR